MKEFELIKKLNQSFQYLGLSYLKLLAALFLMLLTSLLEMSGLLLLYPLILLIDHKQGGEVVENTIRFFFGASISFVDTILVLFLAVAILYVLKNIALYFTYQNNINFSVYYYRNLIKGIYEAYVFKPLIAFKENSSGSLSNMICVQTERLIHGVMRPLLVFVTELLILLSIATLIFFIISPWMIAVIITACLASFALYYLLLRSEAIAWGRREVLAKSNLLELVSNTAQGISEIKVFGEEKYMIDKVYEVADEQTKMFHRLEMYQQAPRYLLESTFILAFLLCFSAALIAGVEPAVILAKFAVVAASSFRLLPSVNRLINSYSNFSFNLAAGLDLLNVILKINDRNHIKSVKECTSLRKLEVREIVLKDVSFNYPSGHKQIITKVNLIIPCGQRLGLMGHSGSGKSTLIKIIAGLFEPTHGSIFVDEMPISRQLRSWQACIGYVPQESFIMPGSVRENVIFGDIKIDDSKIWEVLETVGLKLFVSSWPEKLNTHLGEQGVALSGGQKQLLCLARALLRHPKVLLLDEPTASLDRKNEQIVLSAIYNLPQKVTIIMASHRLDNFKSFDQVYSCENGHLSLSSVMTDQGD